MSGNVWFTSDLHFGHRLVAEHRGFATSDDHDNALTENWLATVAPGDQVWVLGDIAVSSPNYALMVLEQLPGTKHLVAGNHDACHPMHRDSHKRSAKYLQVFESVQSAARRRINGEEVLLSHFPYTRDRGEARYTQWRLPNHGAWLLHGHTHGPERLTLGTGTKEVHVGLDAWDYHPVNMSSIVDLMTGENHG